MNVLEIVCNFIPAVVVLATEAKKFFKRAKYKQYRYRHNFIRSMCLLYNMDRYDYFHNHVVKHIPGKELDWLHEEHTL